MALTQDEVNYYVAQVNSGALDPNAFAFSNKGDAAQVNAALSSQAAANAQPAPSTFGTSGAGSQGAAPGVSGGGGQNNLAANPVKPGQNEFGQDLYKPKPPPPPPPPPPPAVVKAPAPKPVPTTVKPAVVQAPAPVKPSIRGGNDTKEGHGSGGNVQSHTGTDTKTGHGSTGSNVQQPKPVTNTAVSKPNTVYVSPDGKTRTPPQAGNTALPSTYHPDQSNLPYNIGTTVTPNAGTTNSWQTAVNDIFNVSATPNKPSATTPTQTTETHPNTNTAGSTETHPGNTQAGGGTIGGSGTAGTGTGTSGTVVLGNPNSGFPGGNLPAPDPLTPSSMPDVPVTSGHDKNPQGGSKNPNQSAYDSILNLIATSEGTVGHPQSQGYDTVIGYGQFLQPPKPISQMTISEVYQYQHDVVAAGAPSGAVGQYQIINQTLQGLVTSLGLDPNTTLFDQATQDAMATALLDQRGTPAYLNGTLSQDQYMTNLSSEWASLPDPAHGGGSHYPGQPSVSLDTVTGVLNGIHPVPPEDIPT